MRLDKEGKYISNKKKQLDDRPSIPKPKVKTRVTSFSHYRYPEIDKEGYLQCDGTEVPKSEYNDLYNIGDIVKADGFPHAVLKCIGSGTSGNIDDIKPDNISIEDLAKYKEKASTADYQKKVYATAKELNKKLSKYAGYQMVDECLFEKILSEVCKALIASGLHRITAYDMLMQVFKSLHSQMDDNYYRNKISSLYWKYFNILQNALL